MPKLHLIRKDQREFIEELQKAFAEGATWAMCVHGDGKATDLIVTDGPNRYEIIGALEDMKHDLLIGDDDA